MFSSHKLISKSFEHSKNRGSEDVVKAKFLVCNFSFTVVYKIVLHCEYISDFIEQVRKWKPVVTKIQLTTTPCVIHRPNLNSSITNQAEGNGITKKICLQIVPGYPRC